MSDIYKVSDKVHAKSMVSLSVYNVGRQKCTPLYQWGPGVRDHYLIHYVISGHGTYTVGAVTYSLAPGDLFLVFPNTIVKYQADPKDPWEYQWVGFAGSDAAAIIESTDFTLEHPVLSNLACRFEFLEQMQKIHSAFGNTFCDAVRMTGELYLALGLLLQNSSHSLLPDNADLRNVRQSIAYMESHYSYNISIDDVAAYAGISRSTLYRQFMKYLRISPKEYLDDFRIRRACLLLQDTDLSVSSIAASIGIQNSLYFSRTFRKHLGVAPVEFRKRMKKSN